MVKRLHTDKMQKSATFVNFYDSLQPNKKLKMKRKDSQDDLFIQSQSALIEDYLDMEED